MYKVIQYLILTQDLLFKKCCSPLRRENEPTLPFPPLFFGGILCLMRQVFTVYLDCPRACCVDQASLPFIAITFSCLLSSGIKGVSHYSWFFLFHKKQT